MTTQTKDAIKNSFMKLLNRKPLSKITVKEIVEDCGINRNSCYNIFAPWFMVASHRHGTSRCLSC